MTSQSPRVYTYKITFEEVPYYYYGVHKEKRYDEYYVGSPVTNKWCWNFYTPKRQILEFFEFSDEGWIEANKVEQRLIKPVYNTDKWCLNESCAGTMSKKVRIENGKKSAETHRKNRTGLYAIPMEERRERSRKNAEKHMKNKTAIFSLSKEELSNAGKKGGKIAGKISGQKHKENGTGIFSLTDEQKIQRSKKGGRTTGNLHKENGTGIFSLTDEQKIQRSKKGGSKTYEEGKGCFSLTPEERSEVTRKVNNQQWECCETGYVSTAAGVVRYQKGRGISTSKNNRKRIS